MDDFNKTAAFLALLFVLVIASVLGYRVYQDEAMVWFVLVCAMLAFVFLAVGFAAAMSYRTIIAMSVLVVRSIEELLTTARVARLVGATEDKPQQPDAAASISAMLGGVPVQDAVAGAFPPPPDQGDQ